MRKGSLAAGSVLFVISLIGAGVSAFYASDAGLGVSIFFALVGAALGIYGGVAKSGPRYAPA